MSTKGNRSSGTQITPKGINQGNVLVDPSTGLPITVITDNTGKRRLAVDAAITASIGNIDVELDAATDSVRIEDPNTSAHIRVEPDGSINVNIVADAASGDNMMAVGTEDGTTAGTKHVLKIGTDGNAKVKDDAANVTLTGIETNTQAIADSVDQVESALASIDSKLTSPLTTIIGDLNAAKDDVAIAGTENGTATGTVRHFVNNRRQQILASHDRIQNITYADFGTKDQRVTVITYTSPTFPGIAAIKTINYTLVGNKYRRDDIIWSIV